MARQLDRATAVIVGVAGRDDTSAMEAFVARHDLGHVRHIADPNGDVWSHFGVRGQPTWLFVDGETGVGELVFGALGADQLNERMSALEEPRASAPGG